MDEIAINSIEHLRTEIDKCGYGTWTFRGQSDTSWPLEPSINRFRTKLTTINNCSRPLVGKEKLEWAERMRNLEIEMFDALRQSDKGNKAFGETKGIMEGLVDLQHYGAPTRLLDFTYLPYIALYFAACEGVSDFALYAVEINSLEEFNEVRFPDYDFLWSEEGADYPNIFIYTPSFKNERIEMQRGVFLMPTTTVLSFEEVVNNNSLIIKKYTIPSSLRRDVIVMLSQMNIGPKSVYPELEGFVKNYAWDTSIKAFS